MSRIEVNQETPVVEVADGFIKEPVETVWRILSDLESWPNSKRNPLRPDPGPDNPKSGSIRLG